MNKKEIEVFDAFGIRVFIGDWIYYSFGEHNIVCIGQIYKLETSNNGSSKCYPHIHNFTNQILFKSIPPHLSMYNYTVYSGFTKCYNQALIETLENLIKK